MYNYIFHLKESEKPSRFNFIFLALILNLCFFSWLYISGKERGVLIIMGIIMCIAYLVFHLMTKRNMLKKFQPGAAFFFLLVIWLFAEESLPAILNGMFIAAVIYLNRRIKISFNNKGILINSIPTKNWMWNRLSNVVMKDGLLTIDFKSNKLIQWQVDEININEPAFNSFCVDQISNG